MKDVYLDDERETPHGWHRCHHVHEVIALIKANEVRRLSLDHDLGDGEKTGYHLCLWMVENNRWPREKPVVHSANPVGAMVMRDMIERWFQKDWKAELAQRKRIASPTGRVQGDSFTDCRGIGPVGKVTR